MTSDWRSLTVAPDRTHHLRDGLPAYGSRFDEVLQFHEPGMAPVRDGSGAYHIYSNGAPAYRRRFRRTFGFYDGRAAVETSDGWSHVLPDGKRFSQVKYAWCGNFQEGRCPVRHRDGTYSHIDLEGDEVYTAQYKYVGDYRDGYAVVQGEDGLHSHIDLRGELLHGVWFVNLDVYHKGRALAEDRAGWHHVSMDGGPLYDRRFKSIEPFYNGQARVEGFDGALEVVNEMGETVGQLRSPTADHVDTLSGHMVGFWRTQTIRAAVELGVIDLLPATAYDLESKLGLATSSGRRLLRALLELGIVRREEGGRWYAAELGSLLSSKSEPSFAAAADLWGTEHYEAWTGLVSALVSGNAAFEKMFGQRYFEWVASRPERLSSYHAAMSAYAKRDYDSLPNVVDFSIHSRVIDAGGGLGELLVYVLRRNPSLTGLLLDRPEVVELVKVPSDLEWRMRTVSANLFSPWPTSGDAVVLARVLHDWPDEEATWILRHAGEALADAGRLYIVEMVLDDETGNGGLLDLNMLVMTGSGERSLNDFKALLGAAGFELLEVRDTPAVNSVLIAAKAVD